MKKENDIKIYTVTTLKNENYYLILVDKRHSDLFNYKVDKIKNIKVLDSEARCLYDINDYKEGFNLAIYFKKSFKMFPC